MMQPRFVKQVVKDGEVIMDFPPVVLREHIAKPSTIKTMQTILEQVVSIGLGKKAGSPSFKVAGKTGTAQIWTASGKTASYLLSFAGFFPADKPRYSCIVCIQKSGLPASGGGMSGVVVHHISEGIMAQSLKLDVTDARDSTSILIPDVKDGNLIAADYVLSHLGINAHHSWMQTDQEGNYVWGRAGKQGRRQVVLNQQKQYGAHQMPDVTGMGARDAVYLIEKRGVKTHIVGRGRVVNQSIAPGHAIKKGDACMLTLSI
jgi:cell division protein FtsI (penicillin-binding protein 3)